MFSLQKKIGSFLVGLFCFCFFFPWQETAATYKNTATIVFLVLLLQVTGTYGHHPQDKHTALQDLLVSKHSQNSLQNFLVQEVTQNLVTTYCNQITSRCCIKLFCKAPEKQTELQQVKLSIYDTILLSNLATPQLSQNLSIEETLLDITAQHKIC